MPESTYDLKNETDAPLGIWLEPWGTDWTLAPGETFQVVAQSPEAGELEAVRAANRVTVYAWPGCTLKVFRNGVLADTIDFAAPALPPGINMRKFMGSLFGDDKPSGG